MSKGMRVTAAQLALDGMKVALQDSSLEAVDQVLTATLKGVSNAVSTAILLDALAQLALDLPPAAELGFAEDLVDAWAALIKNEIRAEWSSRSAVH
jgi:hypothetical protein